MSTNMPFYPLKMFYSYNGRKHKKSLSRNNYSKFFKKSFSIFCSYRRRYEAMQNKSIEKREKRKKKRTSVLERKRIKDSPYHPVQRPSMLQRKKDIFKRAM